MMALGAIRRSVPGSIRNLLTTTMLRSRRRPRCPFSWENFDATCACSTGVAFEGSGAGERRVRTPEAVVS